MILLNPAPRAGFSMVELLIVMAIMAAMIIIGAPYLFGAQEKARLYQDTQSMAAVIEYAHQQSIGAHEGYQYGVELPVGDLTQTWYRLVGDPARTEDKKFKNAGVSYKDIRLLCGLTNTVEFKKLTGEMNLTSLPCPAPVLIELQSNRFYTEITVNPAGVVSYTRPENK